MDDDELHARFVGLRLAVAQAIKAASRTPAELVHSVAALRDLEGLLSATIHPAIREEIDGVIAALRRMPVLDPAHAHSSSRAPSMKSALDAEDVPRDLIG